MVLHAPLHRLKYNPHPALLRTLEGHTSSVQSVTVTADGKRAVSGSWEDKTLRVWDLGSGRCISTYQAWAAINSVSRAGADGAFVAASGNAVVILMLRNIHMEIPLISSARIWRYAEGENTGQWETNIKAACQWCGQRFPVLDNTLDLIKAIAHKADLKQDQSPCAELPAEAWDEPGLLSECPLCHKPLKFNPFVVDNKEKS